MGSDGLGELVDAVEESIVPHVAVMLDIDDDAWSLVILGQEDAINEELETFQSFLPATNQARRVICPDLKNQVPLLFQFLDFHKETKVSEDGIQNFSWALGHRSEVG